MPVLKWGLIADAYVYHKRRTSIPKFFRQIFNWGVARINLSRRHPHTLKPIHLLPALLIVGLVVLELCTFFTGQNYPPVHFVWNIVDYGLMFVCLFCFLSVTFQIPEHHCCLPLHHYFAHPSLRLRLRITLGRLECLARKGSKRIFKKLLRK